MWSQMSQGSSKRTLTSGLLDEPAFNFELDRDKPPDSDQNTAGVFIRVACQKLTIANKRKHTYESRKRKALELGK
jgi:hypothetical protein